MSATGYSYGPSPKEVSLLAYHFQESFAISYRKVCHNNRKLSSTSPSQFARVKARQTEARNLARFLWLVWLLWLFHCTLQPRDKPLGSERQRFSGNGIATNNQKERIIHMRFSWREDT